MLLQIALAASLAFSAHPGPPDEADKVVVAEGKDFRITAAELRARLAKLHPLLRPRYEARLERKRQFLDDIIQRKLLLAEAKRQGLDRDPEVIDAMENVLINLVTRRILAAAPPAPKDEELRAFFEAHRSDFVRPERVRISLRLFEAPTRSPLRASRNKEATAFLESMKKLARGEDDGFEPTGEGEQGSTWPPSLDDQGFLTREEIKARHGETVAAAAFSLKDAGSCAPVVATDKGFFILRLEGRQSGETTFEQLKNTVAQRVTRERRERQFDDTLGRLRSEARVRVDEAALERSIGTDARMPR